MIQGYVKCPLSWEKFIIVWSIGKEINAYIRMNGLNKGATQKNKCPIQDERGSGCNWERGSLFNHGPARKSSSGLWGKEEML